jgi:transposase
MREEIIEPNIRYSKIGENVRLASTQRRTKLIDLVVNQGFKIRRASKMLKINESTAKSILKLYR